ncbi:MAG: UbiD family decarboxylase [Desulfobacterales bacterium]|nr:UbiD family decarboxylase [Desulfobacterales bacterium]
MAYRDLREWIAKLESEGELIRITARVDWDLELAEISRRVLTRRGPALLFENIKDYGQTRCRKIMVNGIAKRSRVALMLGQPKNTPPQELIQIVRERFKHPVEPRRVDTGPVKENVVQGDDIDLFQFPAPKWHPLDGGRYSDTFCGVVVRDPDTKELNVGLYRGMISSKNKLAKYLIPHQHWGQVYQKYQQVGRPMPVAVVYGWDDVLPFIASAPLAHPPGEYAYMGGMRREAVELVRCETSDLEVPASAEIVFEGFVSPDPATYVDEGPFGEWFGYYGARRKRPVVQVECITHRNDPIFRGQVEGTKPGVISEGGFAGIYSLTPLIWDYLEKAGVPGVLDVIPAPVYVIKIRKMYEGHARQVAAALFGSSLTLQTAKVVVVVDEDVDIRSPRALELALRDRVDPKDDVIVFPGFPGSPLDPSLPLDYRDELKYGAAPHNKLLVDGTIDWVKHPIRQDWGNRRYPPRCTEETLPEIEDLVTRRWEEYGLGGDL